VTARQRPAIWRLGTRGSTLALTQSAEVARALTTVTGKPVQLIEVKTPGDTSSQPLTQIGGTGVFVSALREALLADRIDLAVHSLKDLPTVPAAGLQVTAYPQRADARDVLVCREAGSLTDLPAGARVGTGSPRRAALLLEERPDLRIEQVRGNVDTRLRKLAAGEVDALVLAAAGLERLGRLDVVTEWLDPSVVVPAPGQGALAVETRDDVAEDMPGLAAALAELDHPATRAAVTAERSLLSALEAGCTAPVGALAVVDEPGFHTPELTLRAFVGATDGRAASRMSLTAPVSEAESAGRQLAASLLEAGAVVA
jgi:hydroxymethylbilane synthase